MAEWIRGLYGIGNTSLRIKFLHHKTLLIPTPQIRTGILIDAYGKAVGMTVMDNARESLASALQGPSLFDAEFQPAKRSHKTE